MKVNNIGMVNIINTLKSYSDKKLPQRISYAITRSITLLKPQYNDYETQLNKIYDSYREYFVCEKNGMIKLTKYGYPVVVQDKAKDFENEILELLNIQIDIEIFNIPEDYFNYDESDRYDVLTANQINELTSILCAE